MIIVREKDGILYIQRKGRQRIVIPGEEAEIIRHFLNKLHAEGKLVFTRAENQH